jgi:hypothetical protein
MRREHDVDGQVEERAQPADDLIDRDARPGPRRMQLEAVAAVDQRVACDDGASALDVEHEVVRLERLERADADRERVAAAEHLSAHGIGIGRVGRRDVDRQAELLRVAPVPRAREHDGRRAPAQLGGDVERVEEEDAVPGVDGI